MSTHLHTFSEPVEGEPFARRCRDCDERQVYRAPTGKMGRDFPDVLVDKADLRQLIERVTFLMPNPEGDELVDRLELLLDSDER